MKWLSKLFCKKKSKEESSENEGKSPFLQIPKLDITPEREEEIINSLTKILAYEMGTPALLFLIPLKPVSPIVG